ncbi:MAG TPA: hypothetical protein VN200_04295, partial [Rhodoglobus sp.]|nr:hypothetical protein [Rhodoglobus sp.]
LLPAVSAVILTLRVASSAADSGPWGTSLREPTDVGVGTLAALLALAVVVVLVTAAWALQRLLLARRVPLLAAGSALAVLAAPVTGTLFWTMTAWLLLATAGVGALLWSRLRDLGARGVIALAAASALLLGYVTSWAIDDLWWLGSASAILLSIAARRVVSAAAPRAVLLGIAIVVAFGAAAGVGVEFAQLPGGEAPVVQALRAVVLLGALLVLAAGLWRSAAAVDRVVVFRLAGGGALLALGALALDLGSQFAWPGAPVTVGLAGAVLAAALVWAVPRNPAADRVAARIVVAPAAAWLLVAGADAAFADVVLTALLPVAAAIVVAALALLRRTESRWAWDAGAAATAAWALLWAAVEYPSALWLVLVATAVAVLLMAVAPTGLFGSASRRRQLGWVALALATAGLWTRLWDDGFTAVEPYTLPLAGALLLVALGIHRASPASMVAPFVVLGALAIGMLPSALAGAARGEVRVWVVFAVAAALVLAASWLRGPAGARPYLDVTAGVAAAGVLIAGAGHASTLVIDGVDVDGWIAATFAVLLVAVIGQAGLGDATRSRVAEWTLVATTTALTVIEIAAFGADGAVRVVGVLLALGALHVVGVHRRAAPFGPVLTWWAAGLALVAAVAAMARGAADPIELATAPVAAALLVGGGFRLLRDRAAGSWPCLAPGLLVLLLPSLIATFVDDELWRLVVLGLVCVAAIVAGALLKMQAPLLLGSVIVLVHGARTFAPQLRAIYESTEWWVWAVVGGAVILFLGFTVERRIRDVRAVASRWSALR